MKEESEEEEKVCKSLGSLREKAREYVLYFNFKEPSKNYLRLREKNIFIFIQKKKISVMGKKFLD